MTDQPLLSVRNLKKHYPIKKGLFSRQVGAAKAVDGISFDLAAGETLGIVGESGCGKSTAASSIIRLEEPTAGEVIFNGGSRALTASGDPSVNDVTKFNKKELKAFRRDAQMIFQDPSSSFDPRMTVGSSVAELLQVHGMSNRQRRRAIVEDLLERVGMSASDYDRYPHEFSGGQKQRIAIARALVLDPDLIIADEPVSALDVSVQAEVLSLIDTLQEEFGLSLLIISHNMGVIQQICDRVAVMYLGKIVEIGSTERLFSDPQHPYTEALVSAIPTPDPHSRSDGIKLTGTVPSPSNPPSGCAFHTRCHKVVQPEDMELEQSNWRELLNLRQQVAQREIDITKVRENALGVSDSDDEAEISDAAIKSQIRTEFNLPETLSDPAAEMNLDTALDSLAAEEIDEAEKLLSGTFVTPCELKTPEFTKHGEDHQSRCIRHQETRPMAELSAND